MKAGQEIIAWLVLLIVFVVLMGLFLRAVDWAF